MTSLYKRNYSLIAGALQVSGLRVSFTIDKTVKPEPNTAEIKIYNLSEASRGKIQEKGLFVILDAGYGSDIGTIFKGDLRQATHTREGSDWVSKLVCGDAERSTKYSYLSESFQPGADSLQIVQRCLKALSLGDGNATLSFTRHGKEHVSGLSFTGSAYDLLQTEAKRCRLSVSVQNGAVVCVPDRRRERADLTAFPAVKLTPATGLIGSPEHSAPDKEGKTSPNLKVKALLQHQLQAGGFCQIESLNVKGDFLIEKVVHKGDTHSGEWHSELEVKPL